MKDTEHTHEWEMKFTSQKGDFWNPWSGSFKWRCKHCPEVMPWIDVLQCVHATERLSAAKARLIADGMPLYGELQAYADILEGK